MDIQDKYFFFNCTEYAFDDSYHTDLLLRESKNKLMY